MMTARDRLADWYHDWLTGAWDGDRTPEDYMREWRNVTHAEVHSNGDLYAEEGPQGGHYLEDDAAAEFVAWLEERGAIDAQEPDHD